MDDYILSYTQIYSRKPIADEIIEKFKDSIQNDIIQEYLQSYTPNENSMV